MSIKTQTETRTYEAEVTVERVCELCKKKSQRPDSDNWDHTSSYDVSRVEVSLEVGSSFPEGAVKEKTVFDICPDCFRDVLMVFLRTKGAAPRVLDTGW